MKVNVKITETTVKYVEVDVDSSMNELEIRAAIDHMACNGEIDWDDFDEYDSEMEIIGEVEEDEGDDDE